MGDPEDSCPSDHFHCLTSKACIPTARLCDLAEDCGDGSDEDLGYCSSHDYLQFSFEYGQPWTGLFSVDETADLVWQLGSAEELGVSALAPTFDHTQFNKKGHFLYLPLNTRREGERARLLSHPLQQSNTCTVRFFYHLYGLDVGAIRIYARYEDQSQVESAQFEKSGDQGNVWWSGQVTVGQTSGPWELVVEGEAGEGLLGDVALDDWSLVPGCALYEGPWHGDNVTTPTAPPTTEPPTPHTTHSSPHPTQTNPTGIPDTTPAGNGQEEEGGDNIGIIVTVIILGLVVVLAGIAFGYYRIKKR